MMVAFIMKKRIILFLIVLLTFNSQLISENPPLPGGKEKWQLVWNDEFDYPNENLDAEWYSANGPRPGILSSRWRKNAVVSNGTLKLKYIKETLGGQDWTAGSIWTKQEFKYGYFECRFKYPSAPGTNNSFWFISPKNPTLGKQFEIDVNEGHYPNEINTNLHNLTDVETVGGVTTHPTNSKTFNVSNAKPDYNIILDNPVTTNKIRLFAVNSQGHFHIPEFRIYNVNTAGYPEVFSTTADTDVPGLINFARESSTIITVSGTYSSAFLPAFVVDGTINKHWVSQAEGDKWLQFEFNSNKTIGCIQFINGWSSGGNWVQLLSDYKIQYFNGNEWVDIKSYNSLDEVDLSKEFHTYGLEWNENELIYYYDRKELRRIPNTFCYSPAPIYLSAAVITGAGPVTDAIDGTQMEVDYIRVYDVVQEDKEREYVLNGGFENPTSTIDWKYLKEIGNLSTYSLLSEEPAKNMYSLTVNAKTSENKYGAYVTQKVALDEGNYEFKLLARARNTEPQNRNFMFKFINGVTGESISYDNTQNETNVLVSSEWESYSFFFNFKQDFSAKLVIGFGNEGTFDVDGISLIRKGDVLSEIQQIAHDDIANIRVLKNIIEINTKQDAIAGIYSITGKLISVMNCFPGNNKFTIDANGIYILTLKNQNFLLTKKILINCF